jgi:hypothetical protein
MKLHLCACARLSSHTLGKIGTEIAVLSWNHYYSQGTRTLFHNQETALRRMLQTEFSLSLKIGTEIAVLSWNNFSCQGPRALFH